MKKKTFSFCLVLVVLLAFFACDPNPPSNGSDVKDQSVKDVQPVSNDLKKSGATSFLDLDDDNDFAAFFGSFQNDGALMDLFKNFDPAKLESDEIVQEIMGFIEKLSNTPEETSSINANLNIKNKTFSDLLQIYTLKSSVKANINTTDGKKPNDSQSNVKSTSMSASLESDIECQSKGIMSSLT